MKLTGNLKNEVEQAESRAEAKETILKAGMELTDEELDQVAGGVFRSGNVELWDKHHEPSQQRVLPETGTIMSRNE